MGKIPENPVKKERSVLQKIGLGGKKFVQGLNKLGKDFEKSNIKSQEKRLLQLKRARVLTKQERLLARERVRLAAQKSKLKKFEGAGKEFGLTGIGLDVGDPLGFTPRFKKKRRR